MEFEELINLNKAQLDKIFDDGITPDISAMVGYEYEGINTNKLTGLLGIKKFIKAFDFNEVYGNYGYNLRVKQNAISAPHKKRLKKGKPITQGFFKLLLPSSKSVHPNACIIEYNCSLNPFYEVARLLTDYVVQVNTDTKSLLLGKAYLKAFSSNFFASYFVLSKRVRISEKVFSPHHRP